MAPQHWQAGHQSPIDSIGSQSRCEWVRYHSSELQINTLSDFLLLVQTVRSLNLLGPWGSRASGATGEIQHRWCEWSLRWDRNGLSNRHCYRLGNRGWCGWCDRFDNRGWCGWCDRFGRRDSYWYQWFRTLSGRPVCGPHWRSVCIRGIVVDTAHVGSLIIVQCSEES
jgi:hypothetical protein